SKLRDVRTQAKSLQEKVRSNPAPERDAAIQGLIKSVDSLETLAVSSGGNMGDAGSLDVMSMTPRLTTDVSGLLSAVEGSSAPVTSGEREQFARLETRSTAYHAAAERVLTTQLEHVNTVLKASGLAAIVP